MSHKLTPKQIQAAHLLVRGSSATEVARTLKLRRETLSRWRKIPAFNEELERHIHDLRDSLKYRLTRLVDASIAAVQSELYVTDSDPKRIQTALSVLKALGNACLVYPSAPIPDQK